MKALHFSFIIPVFNRPVEVKELLQSFCEQKTEIVYEIVIIEDGSTETSEAVVNQYSDKLNISYYYKSNSGPGDSRNYGMRKAKGNYFIILDSDVLLPQNYLETVSQFLNTDFYHCYGGPDAAHPSFSDLQKAINFAMTSFLTTGGIRGGKQQLSNYQPRSFNMGLSKEAFEATGGFGKIHPGEDPDLSLRLNQLGYKTTLIRAAYVYHKRRISWKKYYKQVHKFGMTRPILNKWHPHSRSIVYWLPALFVFGFLIALLFASFKVFLPLYGYVTYVLILFVWSSISNRSISIGLQSVIAVCIQFFGYGYGFLKATLAIDILNKKPEEHYPNLFF